MPAKQINITAYKTHSYRMPNKLELTVGFQGENNLSRCLGCVARGFVWDANTPRPIFLTINNSYNNDITNYCIHCSVDPLERLRQDLTNNRLVAPCPCQLCSFDTITKMSITKTQKPKPKDLMNSPDPITICFCVLSDFNILGKLSQEITDYQRNEYARTYKNLATEKTTIKDMICGKCKKTDIDYTYYQVKLENGVANLCGTCKRETKEVMVGKIW